MHATPFHVSRVSFHVSTLQKKFRKIFVLSRGRKERERERERER